LREAIGRTPLPQRNAYKRVSGWIAAPLDEKQFARAWVEGRAMTPKQAFAAHEHTLTSKYTDKQEPVSLSSPARLTARECEVLHFIKP
jgi:hypothetical protein